MSKKLYVGNLPYSIDDNQLQELVAPFGAITSAKVISDKFSGRSKGFGFVEMANDEEAQKAIEGLNGKDMGGRAIVVNEAKPLAPRAPGERGGGGGGFRGERRGGSGGGGGRGRRNSNPL